MIISRETLILESKRKGFRPEILEKVIRLMDLLNAISNDDFLRTRVILKGGTALNLFYFDLPRLSMDIDLNYIGSLDREVMFLEKPKILASFEKICANKQYKIIRRSNEHAGGKWLISYKSELVPQGQLAIDLNFLWRIPLWKGATLNSVQISNYQAVSTPVLDYYDLVGGKLAALFSRHKSRDLFDTYTIFSNKENLDKSKIKFAFMIYGAASRTDIRQLSLEHINFESNDLKNMLLPVLKNEQLKRKDQINLWSEELISVCKAHLPDIISFNENELDFLTHIIERGEIMPELITQDNELIDSIKKNPALLWKVRNVKEYNKI